MDEDYSNFRWIFIKSTGKTILVPACAATAFAQLVGIKFGWFSLIGFQLLSVVFYKVIKVQWARMQHRREARRLGARMIPVLKGRWPGNVDVLLDFRKRMKNSYFHELIMDIFEQYGCTTMNFALFGMDAIITIDEGVVKYVLATGFEHFDKGWRQKQALETMLGNGIFNRDGEMWKMHRAVARPFFARERIADFETFERHTAKTLSVIAAQGSSAFDIQDLSARFTLDTAGTFLFNSELDTLSQPLPKAGETKMGPRGSAVPGEFGTFATAFEQCQEQVHLRDARSELWPLWEMFKSPSEEAMKIISDWLDPMIAKAHQANAARKNGDEEDGIQGISFLEYLAGSTNDVELIRKQLLNILLAGRDTTSALLTCGIYMLTQHSDVLARLREEVLAKCPVGHVPTYDDIRSMKYLRAFLNETLRLFPPVPGDGRASKTDKGTLLPISPTSDFGKPKSMKPLYIPPDTPISYFTWFLQRRKDLWGDDADTFDPDRWIDSRLERMVKNPLIFVPFNAGPRICIGQQFAYNEASFFLIRLLQQYDHFELAPDAQPEGSLPPEEWKNQKGSRAAVEKLVFASAMTLYAKGGVWIRVRKTKDA